MQLDWLQILNRELFEDRDPAGNEGLLGPGARQPELRSAAWIQDPPEHTQGGHAADLAGSARVCIGFFTASSRLESSVRR
jgi:hypothetical protein